MTTNDFDVLAAFREIDRRARDEAERIVAYQDGNKDTVSVLKSIVLLAENAITHLTKSSEG